MKKLVVVFMALVVLLGACAKEPAPTVEAVVPTPEPTQDPGVYYFLAANNSDPFYVPGVQGFNDAGELGVKTEFVGPMDLNINEQLKTFEELVANPNTKGIFWYPMDSTLEIQ